MSEYFEVGEKVTYINPPSNHQQGIIKSIEDGRIFVVFNCGGEWHRYAEFTAALTPEEYLFHGWEYE